MLKIMLVDDHEVVRLGIKALLSNFPEYEVEYDAFMALTLHRIKMHKQRILDSGYILPIVTARGPLCTAGFVRSTTDFMIDLVENPEYSHKLIDLCTNLIIDWLKAQAKIMGDTVEGIFPPLGPIHSFPRREGVSCYREPSSPIA